ncbi:GNAT family N-acetyltransferase [Actinomadura madurae]|uniref:GNAT family N-acetyltransferase n=1 Tax=Actinomadura madurae TaxID=1993 RepID=UPI002026824C|nr:GNAT family N-acetyltransferase [Actinomadura madurae]MCP9953624.1 GNAT family N-acetyltransferase [Actinomadura madurae]MCP9970378.1 GNAT family N-acetyltransferase [Actinomadura madurae]MCP9982860.1 GNAT family N-acetyltransferase [Actinomadura madurae]MCQ0005589.1 GNAT family N-acetyltransferase [Actinomadura madurae]URM99112.1 GNAT family N-acetyltransferase [Actinomadura madurae]
MSSETFGAPARSRLQASLGAISPPPQGFRPFADGDVPALAALMWDAYRGTPDETDVGDLQGAVRELHLTLDGEYGTFLREASFVTDHEGRPVGAALVTLYQGLPLLAFLFTAPAHAGRGLGSGLVMATMHALAEQGHDTLTLAVTRRNRRARRLYDRLGFIEVA